MKRCTTTVDQSVLEKIFNAPSPKGVDQIRDIKTRVAIAWRDEANWVVANVKHSFKPDQCTTVLEGSLSDFVRYSPLITSKFDKRAPFAGSGIQLSLSAGMPNTTTYALTVEPSGRYAVSYGGYMPPPGTSGFEPHRLTQLLVKPRRPTSRARTHRRLRLRTTGKRRPCVSPSTACSPRFRWKKAPSGSSPT